MELHTRLCLQSKVQSHFICRLTFVRRLLSTLEQNPLSKTGVLRAQAVTKPTNLWRGYALLRTCLIDRKTFTIDHDTRFDNARLSYLTAHCPNITESCTVALSLGLKRTGHTGSNDVFRWIYERKKSPSVCSTLTSEVETRLNNI
jgi:hypothetical protein